MADERLVRLSDDELGAALRSLAGVVAWPDARLGPGGPDLASRLRARLVADPPSVSRRGLALQWPVRRALLLALVALLALAVVAGAVAFGVPGIRLIFGDPGGTPPPAVASPSPAAHPGAGLGLGERVPLAAVEGLAGFPVRLPADPSLGPPDAIYLSRRDEVAMVWGPRDGLPPTVEGDVGLLLMQFRGSIAPEPIGKIISTGTVVEPVQLGDGRGFWISGDPHVYFYMTLEGEHVEEDRRWVGDALIWEEGDLTYRLETSLGRDAAIRIAESLE